jgi:hypothetical protein
MEHEKLEQPKKVVGRPFQPGNIPVRISKSQKYLRKHIAAKHIMEVKAKAVTKKAIELALAGDVTCIRLILERIVPIARPEMVELEDRIAALEVARKAGMN